MEHKFAVGETVEFMPNREDAHIPPGRYKVVVRLPMVGRDFQYRVKNAHDGHERIMLESQLSEIATGFGRKFW
jgi:hypothetical protein